MHAPRRGGSLAPVGAATPAHPPCTLLLPSRDRRDRHRSKSRDGSRGDKSVTIQAPGEPLLDNESTRGDERVSWVGGGHGVGSSAPPWGCCRGWEPPAGCGGLPACLVLTGGAVEPVGLALGGRMGSCQRGGGGAGGEGGRAARVQMKGDRLSRRPREAAGMGARGGKHPGDPLPRDPLPGDPLPRD